MMKLPYLCPGQQYETFGLVYMSHGKGCIQWHQGEELTGCWLTVKTVLMPSPAEELACLLEKALTLSAEERMG